MISCISYYFLMITLFDYIVVNPFVCSVEANVFYDIMILVLMLLQERI